jgi:hypothetical protein
MAQGGRVPLHYQAVDAVFRLNTVIKNKLLGILRERQEGPPTDLSPSGLSMFVGVPTVSGLGEGEKERRKERMNPDYKLNHLVSLLGHSLPPF